MGEFKGTRGPWAIDTYGAIIDPTGDTISVSAGIRITMNNWGNEGKPKENARLISAAPELLDALLYQKRHQDGDASCDLQTFLHMRDAAISKALGEDNGN